MGREQVTIAVSANPIRSCSGRCRSGGHGEGDETFIVVLCAPREESTPPLLAALAEFAPVHINPERIPEANFGAVDLAKVAIVDFDDVLLTDSGLHAVRALRNAEFDVIGWVRGSDGWPVKVLARALIAGAAAVVDSEKPNAADHARQLVEGCLQAQSERRDERAELSERMRALGIVTCGPRMLSLFGDVLRVSRLSDVPVLITGETGTGKELIARAIHTVDVKRCQGPFLPLNCAALATSVAESELFGHHRGAFTGADRHRQGLFRAASGGILFLDEIGELELGLQAKLLRAMQEGRVLGVGEDRETEVDTRVVAATNRSLPEMIADRKFRPDLYHRLSVVNLHVPPLRERRNDLPALIRHFVEKHRELAVSSTIEVSSEFVEALAHLDLPGNVRQLENLVRRALLARRDASPLGLWDLPHEVWQELSGSALEQSAVVSAPEIGTRDVASIATRLLDICRSQNCGLPRLMAEVERLILKAALEAVQGDLTKAGTMLGLKSRTLYNKRHKNRVDA
jgi:DNA-binding NtrC family response regulator